MSWTRVIPLAAVGALAAAGVACYFLYSSDADTTALAPAPVADPALVAQTAARAASGDAEAQLQMGLWCLEGSSQKHDDRQAAEWLRKAAEAGNAEAQYRLGTLCQAGRGTERNATNAWAWFKKAADQRHVAALYNLGSMVEAGQGLARDTEAAARYFLQAAELGDAYAQYIMARRCEVGLGVPQNLAEAWKWYELANAGGVPDTLHARAALESRLSTAQLREARRAAEELRRKYGASSKRKS
jgi:TPR repeat protein